MILSFSVSLNIPVAYHGFLRWRRSFDHVYVRARVFVCLCVHVSELDTCVYMRVGITKMCVEVLVQTCHTSSYFMTA
jgi:hypothetical protein